MTLSARQYLNIRLCVERLVLDYIVEVVRLAEIQQYVVELMFIVWSNKWAVKRSLLVNVLIAIHSFHCHCIHRTIITQLKCSSGRFNALIIIYHKWCYTLPHRNYTPHESWSEENIKYHKCEQIMNNLRTFVCIYLLLKIDSTVFTMITHTKRI